MPIFICSHLKHRLIRFVDYIESIFFNKRFIVIIYNFTRFLKVVAHLKCPKEAVVLLSAPILILRAFKTVNLE